MKTRLTLILIIVILAAALIGTASAFAVTDTNEITICQSGCDFTTIQAAHDDVSVTSGSIFYVKDAVHTEEGIEFTKDIILQGDGPEETILQAHVEYGQAHQRVLSVLGDAKVRVEGVTIRHGNPDECPMYGGGVFSEGDLTLINVYVEDNIGSAGGGIMAEGKLLIQDSLIRRNNTHALGGNSMCGGHGGGLMFTRGTARIENTTIMDNITNRSKAGGIYVSCSSVVEITNSTIARNHAIESGGAIYSRGHVILNHVTIAGNTAVTNGGGLYTRGNVEMDNTIITDNWKGIVKEPSDCVIGDDGFISRNILNLISDGSCDAILSGDAELSRLEPAQSEMWVYVPMSASPAIDVIPAELCSLQTDQRGQLRPDAPGDNCDLGAVEAQPKEKNRTTRMNIFLFVSQVVMILLALVLLAARKNG